MSELSGYRSMWMMTLFDLPVLEKKQRKAASDFRKYLLKEGFHMIQLSVYMKYCRDKTQADLLAIRIAQAVPPDGKLDIVIITDKQYENIVTYYGERRQHREKFEQATFF